MVDNIFSFVTSNITFPSNDIISEFFISNTQTGIKSLLKYLYTNIYFAVDTIKMPLL